MRLGLIAAFVLRVAIGLAAIDGYRPTVGDPSDYVEIAERLLAGEGYALPWSAQPRIGVKQPAVATAYRPPLYPLFLAGVFAVAGHRLSAVVVVQAALDTVSCLLIGRIALATFGSAAGVFAVWWAALYPGLWIHVTRIWAECLFVFLAVALLFVASREARTPSRGGPLAAGALLGLLCLTRPNGVFFLPAVGVCVVGYRSVSRTLTRLVLFVAAAVVVVLPWAARNYLEFHRWIPFSTMSAVVARGAYHDRALNDPNAKGGWVLDGLAADVAATSNELELHDRAWREAREWARQHLRDLPRLFYYRARRFWSPSWVGSEIYVTSKQSWIRPLGEISYLLTLGVALVGLCLARRQVTASPYLLATPLSFTVCAMLTWGNWRLRAPVEPVLVLLASAVTRVCRKSAHGAS